MQFQETEEELERVRAEKDDECAKLRALLDAERRRAAGGGAAGDAMEDDAARVPRADHDAALARVEQLERDVAAAQPGSAGAARRVAWLSCHASFAAAAAGIGSTYTQHRAISQRQRSSANLGGQQSASATRGAGEDAVGGID